MKINNQESSMNHRNQSININQSIDINQSFNLSFIQSINPSINRYQSINQPIK